MRMNVARLANELKSEIWASSAAEGTQIPSINEICAKYKTSPATALKSVKTLEAEGLVKCIRGKGVFLKSIDRASRIWRVGLLTIDYSGGNIEREFIFGLFPKSAAEELRACGRKITRIFKEDLYSDEGSSILDGLDGLICTSGCLDAKTLPKLLKWGRPIVVMQHEGILPHPFHQVTPDLYGGFLKAVQFLGSLNVGKLTLAAEATAIHQERLSVFRQALRAGLPDKALELDLVEEPCVALDMGRMTGRRLGERILSEGHSLGAIFSPSDLISFGILDCFLERGLKPGKDFKLIGFDNFEGSGLVPFGAPLLSSVDFPRGAIAREAVRLLLRLERYDGGLTHIVRVPCDLIHRATTKGA